MNFDRNCTPIYIFFFFVGLKVFGLLSYPMVRLFVGHQHSYFWLILVRFVDYYSRFWPVMGPRCDFHDWRSPGCVCMSGVNTHSFGEFWPFRGLLLTVFGSRSDLHSCWIPRQFWPILARFVDYYSPFWGPEAICTIGEIRGAFTCWSSTLTILADSGPFHGLLLTVFGS